MAYFLVKTRHNTAAMKSSIRSHSGHLQPKISCFFHPLQQQITTVTLEQTHLTFGEYVPIGNDLMYIVRCKDNILVLLRFSSDLRAPFDRLKLQCVWDIHFFIGIQQKQITWAGF